MIINAVLMQWLEDQGPRVMFCLLKAHDGGEVRVGVQELLGLQPPLHPQHQAQQEEKWDLCR